MNRSGFNTISGCPLFTEFVADFAALEHISLPSAHTVLLIAADTRGVRTDAITRVAERFLASGLVYVCAWGPDCERVHDIFDEVHVGDGTVEPRYTLMSSWHSRDSLEDAILFFIEFAIPVNAPIGDTSYLAVTVGDASWSATVDFAWGDLPAFKTHQLDNSPASNGFVQPDAPPNAVVADAPAASLS